MVVTTKTILLVLLAAGLLFVGAISLGLKGGPPPREEDYYDDDNDDNDDNDDI